MMAKATCSSGRVPVSRDVLVSVGPASTYVQECVTNVPLSALEVAKAGIQVRPIGDRCRQRTMSAELDDRYRANRTTESVAEASDVDAQQGAQQHAYRCLV